MDHFNQIALNIIREQALIIGPIAWEEANKIAGIEASSLAMAVVVTGSPQEVIDRLVGRFEQFFGKASHEVCRDAARTVVSQMQPEMIPASLR